ncbi:hypothetical protein NDU88_005269 [Pleurodeles waltl]|uniref:Uncharacterized protein n=1 Tax=Pleurodeles waltl TaxID=8319 RepID=A0AAV7VLJ4_PLEWA|nr:hypothetical protein NDU88_005269 [Pleurodeles waltl]
MLTEVAKNHDPVSKGDLRGRGAVSPEIAGTLSKNIEKECGSPHFEGEMTDEQRSRVGPNAVNLGETNCNVEPRSLILDITSQENEDMVKSLSISGPKNLSLNLRGKEEQLIGIKGGHGLLDTIESFFSLSDQSKDSDSDEEIPLTESDLEGSSSANIWASNHLTCRRKSFEQPSSRGNLGTKFSGEPPNTQDEVCEMQWDYTTTQQAFLKVDSTNNNSMGPGVEGPAETPSLEPIYHTMVHNHEQTQKESRKGKLANRQLQLSIKKVVKSCQYIGTQIASMETRTEELETEVKAAAAQTVTQGQQILDIQWILEDAENRQRLNNLRILGIAEGQDTRAYIVSLFKKAFPDHLEWNWEIEIQRAHRFPLMRKKQTLDASKEQSYPRAIVI